MSWVISLSIGPSFVELTAQDDKNSQSRRWYRPLHSPEKCVEALAKDIGQDHIREVRLSLRWGSRILRQSLGTAPAALVTSGFEHWLELAAPATTGSYTAHPKRVLPMIDDDLTFGIKERVSAQGESLNEVDPDEIDFVGSKLQMMEKQHVAVTFLHSEKQPEHEQKAAEKLKELGLKTYLSSQLSTHPEERPRWWRAILSAYMAPVLEELAQDWVNAFQQHLDLTEEQFLYYDDPKWVARSHSSAHDWVAALFAEEWSLYKSLKEKWAEDFDQIFYLGMEDFVKINFKEPTNSLWHSPVGPVAVETPPAKALSLQPTTLVQPSSWGNASFQGKVAGYEPGPMCMGRGVQPLLLDILYLNDEQNWPDSLKDRLNSKTKPRILEALSAMSRSDLNQESIEINDVVDGLTRLATNHLLYELDSLQKPVGLCGPMAPLIKSLLRSRKEQDLFQIMDTSDFIMSQSLVKE